LGDEIIWQPDITSTGSATLNVDAAGAATIKRKAGAANLSAGDVAASPAQYLLMFEGTNWEIQGQTGQSTVTGNAVYSNAATLIGETSEFTT
jgi:hypothetical protein